MFYDLHFQKQIVYLIILEHRIHNYFRKTLLIANFDKYATPADH